MVNRKTPSKGDNRRKVLVIDGRDTDRKSEYAFEVSGTVRRSPKTRNANDSVSDGGVTGTVDGSASAYRFTGDVVGLSVDGPASVSFDLVTASGSTPQN
jgi:hypothetical protein